MNISVIIPTLNEARNIAQAVRSAWACGANEVIVADGGSQDETLAIATGLDCKIVHSPAGRGTQLNRGADCAGGEVLLFLHADNRLVLSGCDQIRSAFSDMDCQCGAFRQAIESQKLIYRLIEFGNSLRVSRLGMAYGDQGIFVRAKFFAELGGFDNIPLMEDFRFSQKVKQQTRFKILPGPIFVDARHWESKGSIRRTLSNWRTVFQYLRGVDPEILAARYYADDCDESDPL